MTYGLRSGDVERLVGLSRRQIQYAREAGLIEGVQPAPGCDWRYTEADIRRLRLLSCLRRNGVSYRRIQRLLPDLALEVHSIVAEAISRTHADWRSAGR